MMSSEESIEQKAQQFCHRWLKLDRDRATRKEVLQLLECYDYKTILKRMTPRISFGTAGLRGKMHAGFACMNSLTVQAASQGLCRALEQEIPHFHDLGVVIGFDGRHNSRDFAELVAHVFASQGIAVSLFGDTVPTPFVPFAVVVLKAAAGIMITASHNPSDDNGYKVYWQDGSQVAFVTVLLSQAVDRIISDLIVANEEPWDGIDEVDFNLITDPLDDISDQYFSAVAKDLCFFTKLNSQRTTPKVVFTAMHGVGGQWMTRAFQAFNLPPFFAVKEQFDPNPDFPTVTFPNPEEGAGALKKQIYPNPDFPTVTFSNHEEGAESLKLSYETARALGATLILACDPDADRLSICEQLPSGEWRQLNGNEIGILLGHWFWTRFHEHYPDVPPGDCCMASTAVSSQMLRAFCSKEGLCYEETLTGFKWLGQAALKFMEQKKHFLFSYEEAIGFVVGSMSVDKDGIRAGAVAAEMALYYWHKYGRTLVEQLDLLHRTYGYFAQANRYFFCYDPAVMHLLFGRIRNAGNYPKTVGRFRVRHVRDLTVGVDTSQDDRKPLLPVSSSSEMITFFFENDAVASLRGSGTEPKLKYYIEMSGSNKETVNRELLELKDAIITHLLQPERNHLKAPK